ncbi:MAG: hypothetical protein R3C19_05900 [Planctomycetaceae bacterium]
MTDDSWRSVLPGGTAGADGFRIGAESHSRRIAKVVNSMQLSEDTIRREVGIGQLRPLNASRRIPAVTILILAILLTGGMSHALAQDSSGEDTADELFFFPPDTPERLVKAAELARGVDRPDLSRGYLRKLLDGSPSADQLMALRESFGTGPFLRMNADSTMQPEAGELLSLINEAARQGIATDAELTTLVEVLGGTKPQIVDASMKLLSAGNRAVPAMLAADSTTDAGRIADALLTKYARQYRFGLLAAIENADEATQVRILNRLATVADPEIALPLLRYQFASESGTVRDAAALAVQRLMSQMPAPQSAHEAAELLARETEELLKSAGKRFRQPVDIERDNRLGEMFGADIAAAERPYGSNLVRLAARLGGDAIAIQPASSEAAAAKLASKAATENWPARWPNDVNLHDAADEVPSTDESSVTAAQALETALRTENAAAAIHLLNRGDVQAAVTQIRNDLLRDAIASGDPRIRLIAAAIVQNSGRGFPGTSLYRDVIRSAVHGTAMPEAVAIDSRPDDSRHSATVLADLGFSSRAATSGARGFDAATGQMNSSLILIHCNVHRWTVSPTVSNLRADARTRLTPIVIYGDQRDASAVSSLVAAHPGVWFVVEPFSQDSLATSLELRDVVGPLLTDDERRAMIAFASGLGNQAE